MRQRKAKDLEKRLQACSEYMIDPSSEAAKGSFFDDGKELYLEIGCGKGSFIIQKSLEHPEANFLAIEGQETVILRALEKTAEKAAEKNDEVDAEEAAEKVVEADVERTLQEEKDDGSEAGQRPLSNLKFMLTFVHRMDEFFHEGQLAGIYLNFSDPWPKARHAKRRLTYRDRLRDYAWALKEGGFVECKTDNDDLYAFSLEEIDAAGYEITEQTTDLHNSDFASRLTMTEYEEKFKAAGKNINYVKFVV